VTAFETFARTSSSLSLLGVNTSARKKLALRKGESEALYVQHIAFSIYYVMEVEMSNEQRRTLIHMFPIEQFERCGVLFGKCEDTSPCIYALSIMTISISIEYCSSLFGITNVLSNYIYNEFRPAPESSGLVGHKV